MGNKYCARCKKTKPETSFASHSLTKDKKQPWCKKCQNKYNIERYYRINDQTKVS